MTYFESNRRISSTLSMRSRPVRGKAAQAAFKFSVQVFIPSGVAKYNLHGQEG